MILSKKQLNISKKWAKTNVQISRELRDIIHGYIFSDGYVTPSGSLQVDQSEEQEMFVKWLYDKLELIRTNTPISNISRTDKRSGNNTYSKRFYTKNLLQGFRFMWYKPIIDKEGNTKYVKRLPKSIACFFNSICISLWFAGDGGKRPDCRGAYIEVTAFSTEERHILKELFKQKFDISVSINRAGVSKSGTEQWKLAINEQEYDKFRHLITQMDLIPKLFSYKLHKQK